MKEKAVFFICLNLITILIFPLSFFSCNEKSNEIPKIVIFQDKPQEWADALKLGFTDGLIENGIDPEKDIILISRLAAGDPQSFSTMVSSFANGNYKIIYTLGTQSSQDMLTATKEKNIIFGAVTDPIKAQLYKDDLNHPLGNITGTQDLWPYPAQFDLIQGITPKINKIGVVYKSSEINSQVSINLIKKECDKRGLILEEKSVTSESEIELAISALLNQKIDMLFIPADNTAQTSSATIISLCNQKSIPVFTGISGIVEKGAIATVGINYYELGKVNSKQATLILKENKLAKDIPVAIAEKGDIYLNMSVANKLGLTFSEVDIKNAKKKY